jgi:hypothetical protein
MKNILLGTLSAITLVLAVPASQAASVGYSFSVSIDSGSLAGQSFAGSFSYDDAQVPVPNPFGGDLFELSSFDFSFVGGPFAKADLDYAGAVLDNGSFIGLELGDATFAFLPASGPFAASFAYDFGLNGAGNGSIVYTPRMTELPEPGTAWLAAGLLAGLAGVRRRSRPQQP